MLDRISLVEFGFLLSISLSGWIFLGWRAVSQKQPLLRQTQSKVFPIGLFDIFLLILLWGGGQALGQLIFVWINGIPLAEFSPAKLSASQINNLTLTIKSCEAVGLLLAFAYLMARYRDRCGQFWTNGPWANVKIGLIAGLLILPWILLIHMVMAQLIPYQHGTLRSIQEDPSSYVVFIAWSSAVIYAPIAEEFFCRIGIQSWVRRIRLQSSNEEFSSIIAGGIYKKQDEQSDREDDVENNDDAPSNSKKLAEELDPATESISPMSAVAIIVTAGFFGFLHLGQGLALVPLFVMALALGYIFEKTRSLIPCIIVHFVLNAHSMLWATLRIYWDA